MKYKIPEGLSKEETHFWAKDLLENGKPEGDLRWLCRLIKVTESRPVETAIDIGNNSNSISVVVKTIEQTKSNLTELFSKEEIRSAFKSIEESRESRNLEKLKDINLDDNSSNLQELVDNATTKMDNYTRGEWYEKLLEAGFEIDEEDDDEELYFV